MSTLAHGRRLHSESQVTGLGKLAATVSAALLPGTLAMPVVTDDKVAFVALLAGVVGVVVAIVAWVRKQVKDEIRAHNSKDRVRHKAVLGEIRHMRELLHLKFGLPLPEPLEDLDDDGGEDES